MNWKNRLQKTTNDIIAKTMSEESMKIAKIENRVNDLEDVVYALRDYLDVKVLKTSGYRIEKKNKYFRWRQK